MSASYFVLAEFVLAAIFHSVAIVKILSILRSNVRKSISLFFMALLINWSCAALCLLPYEVYAISVWQTQIGVLRPGNTLFFIAIPAHLLLSSIPVSVFFLTIDRICIIRLGHNYGCQVKRLLRLCYVATLTVGIMFNFGGMLTSLPVPTLTDCEIFGCILGTGVQFYLGWRAFCAIFNTTSGIIFFVDFYRSTHKMGAIQSRMLNTAAQMQIRRANRANNFLTSFAIVSELFLSFLPHFLPFIWEKWFGVGSSLGTGPLSELASSVEVLLFSSLYSYFFSARDDSSTHGTAPNNNGVGAAAVAVACHQQQGINTSSNCNNNNKNANNLKNGRRRSNRVMPMLVPAHPIQHAFKLPSTNMMMRTA